LLEYGEEAKRARNNAGSKLRVRCGLSGVTNINYDSIQKVADYVVACIRVYNILGKVYKEFVPQSLNKKSGKSKERCKTLNILQIPGEAIGHAVAMIPKAQLHTSRGKRIETWVAPPIGVKEITAPTLIKKGRNKKKEKRDNKIAVGDLETTTRLVEDDPIGKYPQMCYAGGVSWLEGKEFRYKSFWGQDSIRQMLRFWESKAEYFDGYTYYFHNGGKFDYYVMYHQGLLDDPYWVIKSNSMIELNSCILQFTIQGRNNNFQIHFKDSYRLLTGSLDRLASDMQLKHQKQEAKVMHDGRLQSLHDIVTMTNFEQFPQLKTYLEYDCKALMELMDLFSRETWENPNLNINITSCVTAANMAKKLFYKNFYDPDKMPIYNLPPEMDSLIRGGEYRTIEGHTAYRTGFAGGRVEVHIIGDMIKRGIKGPFFYLDWTSLYPYVGEKYDLPYGMPKMVKGESLLDENGKLREDAYGFILVEVTTDLTADLSKFRPLHANVRNSRLMFEWFETPVQMVLFTEEIKLSQQMGLPYKYKFKQAVLFCRGPLYKSFFRTCFDLKAKYKKEGKPAASAVFKLTGNAGFGFQGLKTIRRDGVLLQDKDNNELLRFFLENRLKDYKIVNEYMFLRGEKDLRTKNFNVGIASAITSLARMELYKGLCDIGQVADLIYCDTDSIISNCNLRAHPALYNKLRWDGKGAELGTLKNEAEDKFDRRVIEAERAFFPDGELGFDTCIVLGAKMYYLEYTYQSDLAKELIQKGELKPIVKTHALKGFSNRNGEINRAMFEKMAEDETNRVTQEQMQMRSGRDGLLNRNGELRRTTVKKSFRSIYNKGIVGEDGKVQANIFK
jgi:hypothetical protein